MKAANKAWSNRPRESVARILRVRFPKAQTVARLDEITSLEKLNHLLDAAATAKTIAEFRRAFPNGRH